MKAGMSNLASKSGQIGPKWDKSGTFEDQFQFIFARRANFTNAKLNVPAFMKIEMNSLSYTRISSHVNGTSKICNRFLEFLSPKNTK